MNEYDENSKNTEEETDPQSDNKESNKPDGGSGGNGGGYEQVCSMCHRPESRCGGKADRFVWRRSAAVIFI